MNKQCVNNGSSCILSLKEMYSIEYVYKKSHVVPDNIKGSVF